MVTVSTEFKIEKIKSSKIEIVDWDNIGFGRFYSDHMFMADCENGKWKNGQILPFQNLEHETLAFPLIATLLVVHL